MIRPSAYLPVSGSGVVWTGLKSSPVPPIELAPLTLLRMVEVIVICCEENSAGPG